MKIRTLVLTLASFAIGVVLIEYLIALGKIDLRDTLRRLRHLDATSFVVFTLLMALHIFLSAQKWRTIDCVMRRPGDTPVAPTTSFALSSAGAALGQLLPAALGMAMARTLGTYAHGRALRRGTVGTIFEQGFDFLIICVLIPASLAARYYRGGALIWLSIAAASILLTVLCLGAGVRLLDRIAVLFQAGRLSRLTHLTRGMAVLRDSGLLNTRIARKLAVLSVIRFIVLVLMAEAATKALGIEVSLWHLAGAMPFVIFSSVIAISPGALGVSELTYATALTLFGTPLSVAAQFVLANRFLVVAASVIIAVCSTGVLFVKRTLGFLGTVRSEPLVTDRGIR